MLKDEISKKDKIDNTWEWFFDRQVTDWDDTKWVLLAALERMWDTFSFYPGMK